MARITKVFLGLATFASLLAAGTAAAALVISMAITNQQIEPQGVRHAFLATEQIVEPFSGINQISGERWVLRGFDQMLNDPAEEKLKVQRVAAQLELMKTYIDTSDPRLHGWVNLLAAAH